MAVYLSNANGTGNWSTIQWLTSPNGRAPWTVAASGPVSNAGDKIVIKSGDDITYNVDGIWGDDCSHYAVGTGVSLSASNAIVVSAKARLRASRTQSTGLTARGTIYVSPLSAFLDWGTETSPIPEPYTARIVLNYNGVSPAPGSWDATPPTSTTVWPWTTGPATSGSMGIYVGTLGASTIFTENSATFVGAPKQRNTYITADAVAAATTIYVQNYSGWKVNDVLYVESPSARLTRGVSGVLQPQYTKTTITAINTNTGAITINPGLNVAVPAGTYVGNFTSNVVIEPYDSKIPSFGIYNPVNIGNVFQCKDVQIKNMGMTWNTPPANQGPPVATYPDRIAAFVGTTAPIAAVTLDVGSSRSAYTIDSCSFEAVPPIWSNVSGFSIFGQTPLVQTIKNCCQFSSVGSGTRPNFLPDFTGSSNGLMFRINNRTQVKLQNNVSYGGGYNVLPDTGVNYSIEIENCRFHSFLQCFGLTTHAYELKMNNCFVKSQSGCLGFFDGLQAGSVQNCTLSTARELPVNMITLNEDGLVKIKISNTTTNASVTSIGNNSANSKSLIEINNINGNQNQFIEYNSRYTATNEGFIKKRGTTSFRVRQMNASESFAVYKTMPAIANTPQRIIGNVLFDTQYLSAGSIPPTIIFEGAGITKTEITFPATADTWHPFDVNLTPTSTDIITFTLSGFTTTGTNALTSTGAFVYLDGIPFSPIIKTVRHYGFLYDAALDRTVNPLTTLTENQVSVLNNVNNLDYLYDAASYWSVANPGLSSYLDLFSVNGGLLDFNSLDVIVNENYWTGFHYLSTLNNPSNISGAGTIILKTPNLSAGTHFNSIKTTGSIILSSGVLSNIDINANVVQPSATNLTGVYMLNNAKTYSYNMNDAVEIEFTNCNIYGLTNDGTAIVTVKKTGTTTVTESDAEIVTYLPTLINLTLQGGYVALYNNTGTRQYYQNTDGTIVLPAAATGTWTYKVARYGYELFSGSFTVNPNIGGTVDINPTYVPDTFITENNVATVIAYTDLNTTAKIHDYISYIRTTSAGIDYGTLHTQSFGTLTFNADLTLDATAASVFDYTGGVITLKCSSLTDDLIYFVDGDFTQSNGNTISNGIKIRANNLDSEFYFANVDSLVFYPTENDRNNNTNTGPSITSETIYRFLYGATVSGVTFSNYVYLRVTVGGTTLLNTTALAAGTTNIDFGTTGNIQVILNNQKIINQGIQKASKLIPHSTNI